MSADAVSTQKAINVFLSFPNGNYNTVFAAIEKFISYLKQDCSYQSKALNVPTAF